jgi:hypothetical protein
MWLLLASALADDPPAAPTPAEKAEGKDVPVRVVVHDAGGKPIPTAVVRQPQEMDRHRVNSVDGSWEASVLYLPDGTEMHFLPGLHLELEISAPGFLTQVLNYDVRKRRNVVEVVLPAVTLDETEIEEPTIGFGRDEPREGD